MELVRYLHLNPLRAKVVADLRKLDRYPWTGHGALLGTVPLPCQAVEAAVRAAGWRLTLDALVVRVCRQAEVLPEHLGEGSRRSAVSRARDGIAYLLVEFLGHPGRLLAPVLGVRPQAIYQAVARGREARAEWERLLGS